MTLYLPPKQTICKMRFELTFVIIDGVFTMGVVITLQFDGVFSMGVVIALQFHDRIFVKCL